jgi:exosortase O
MTQDLAQLPSQQTASTEQAKWQAINSAIILSWFYLNWPTLKWFGHSLQNLSSSNQLILTGVGLLFGIQASIQIIRNRHSQDIFSSFCPTYPPTVRWLPLALLLGSAVASIGGRWWIEFEQLPALLFLLGSYGLVGLFLCPTLWRKGLATAVAIAAVVPFWLQFTTGLGFPARILTAQAVEALLHSWHITALSSEDIIVLETGIAHVDLPCSGLKSLWMGTVLLLSMTWLEKRQIGLRWLFVWLVNLSLLVVANIARVLTLVILIYVLRQPALADIVHVPLGLLSFVMVSLTAWGMLRWIPQYTKSKTQDNTPFHPSKYLKRYTNLEQRTNSRSRFFPPALIAGLLALSLIPRPTPAIAALPSLSDLTWSAPMQAETVPLFAHEQAFFANHPGVVAEKQRFEFEGITGSMILVSSPTWQAHHSPELCYVSGGLRVNQMSQQQLTPTILGRWLSLDGNTRSAAYWFQSPDRTTDSYLERLWADLTRQERNWTLVSILFDQPHQPQEAPLPTFLDTVQAELHRVQN